MYITLKEFIFSGKQWKRGAVFDETDIAPLRLKILEQARFIVAQVDEPKKVTRTRTGKGKK